MPLSNGQILQSRYRILRPLGQGGMGAVYLAEHTQLAGRRFAIKENVPDPSASAAALAQRRQQFLTEAQVLAALDHPHLPKVSDYFAEGGNEYLVMDYVEGQNLEEALAGHLQQQGRPLPEKPVLIWAGQVLDALEYLHGQRPHPIIHRDIKPSNIVLTPQGKVKLVDFGLVKLYDPNRPGTVSVIQGMGTLAYTPLEQYGDGTQHTDARTDIYALGATLYHLLTGVAPPSVRDRLLDPAKLAPPQGLNPALSPATATALLRAMEIHPDRRFQSAQEMRQVLAGIQASLQVGGVPVAPPVVQPWARGQSLPGHQARAAATRSHLNWLPWGGIVGVVLLFLVLGFRPGGFLNRPTAVTPTIATPQTVIVAVVTPATDTPLPSLTSVPPTATDTPVPPTPTITPTLTVTSTPTPGVLVVAPSDGDYDSIQAAIDAADPGMIIHVRPATYQEGVDIYKEVHLVGLGDRDQIVIEASDDNVIYFEAERGMVKNLTLRLTQSQDIRYAVNVAGGELLLEDCDITSNSGAVVGVHDGGNPTVRNNRIHDGQSGGVFVYDNGLGVFEANDIYGNAKPGIEVKTGGNPTVRNNRIYDGQSGGVFVYDNGLGVFEENDIYGNAYSGIEVETGGNPTVRNNRIHDGQSAGVLVYDNGLGVFEENDIYGNAHAGLAVKTGGSPTVRNNQIHDGQQSGVYVYEIGLGVFDENDIYGNTYSGIAVETGGNPTVRNNRIHDGQQSGVFVNDNSLGVFEENDIYGNVYAGIEIKTSGNPTVRNNRIHDGQSAGVFVYDNGLGVFEENAIYGNASAGIAVKSGGNPTVRNNRINRNGYEAIWVYEGGRGTYEGNDLRDNTRGAWDISTDSQVIRRNNQE